MSTAAKLPKFELSPNHLRILDDGAVEQLWLICHCVRAYLAGGAVARYRVLAVHEANEAERYAAQVREAGILLSTVEQHIARGRAAAFEVLRKTVRLIVQADNSANQASASAETRVLTAAA